MTSKNLIFGQKMLYNIKTQLKTPPNIWNRLTESMRMLSCEDIVFEAYVRDLYLKFYTLFSALPFVLCNLLWFFVILLLKKLKNRWKSKVFCVFYKKYANLWKNVSSAIFAARFARYSLLFWRFSSLFLIFCYFFPVFLCFGRYIGRTRWGDAPR